MAKLNQWVTIESVANGSSASIDLSELTGEKLRSLLIKVDSPNWVLSIGDIPELIFLFGSSETTQDIDSSFSVDTTSPDYFTFESNTTLTLTNNSGGTSKVGVYVSVIGD